MITYHALRIPPSALSKVYALRYFSFRARSFSVGFSIRRRSKLSSRSTSFTRRATGLPATRRMNLSHLLQFVSESSICSVTCESPVGVVTRRAGFQAIVGQRIRNVGGGATPVAGD